MDDDENAICESKTEPNSEQNSGAEESDNEEDKKCKTIEVRIPQPVRLQLSFERISATGMYLLDVGDLLYLYLSRGLHAMILERVFGVTRLNQVTLVNLLNWIIVNRKKFKILSVLFKLSQYIIDIFAS